MNKDWYSIKVKYSAINDNGNPFTATADYLLEAQSYLDAEVSISEKLTEMGLGRDLKVDKIVKQKLEEVLALTDEDGIVDGSFFEAKITTYTVEDEEKSTSYKLVVEESSIVSVIVAIDKMYSDFGADYEVVSVVKKPYLSAFFQEDGHQVDIFQVIKEEEEEV